MWIKRVRLSGFGCFNAGLDLEFDDGVNVVLGPNESGKSTLMEAIVAVVYGLPTREAEEARRPRGPHDAYSGEVVLMDGETEYRVTRDFETNRTAVTRRRGDENAILFQGEANPRGRTDDLTAYLDVVAQVTGVRDRELAVRTMFMRQGELETSVDGKVRHLLSGTRTGDYDEVLEKLEAQYAELTRENPWGADRRKDRAIEDIDARIDDLARRAAKAREGLSLGGYISQEIDETARALAEVRDQLEDKTDLFRNYNEFFEVNRERSDLEKRLRTLRDEREKVKALTADCTAAEKELWPRFEMFRDCGPDLGESLRLLSTLQRDVESMKDELEARESELESTPWPHNLRKAIVIAVISAVLGFAAMWGAGVPALGVAVGFSIGMFAFVGIFYLGKGKEKRRILLEGQVVELAERLERQRAEMTSYEEQLGPVLKGRRPREIMEEFRQFREKADLLSRYEQIRDSHRSVEDVEADYDDVFNKLKKVDARARDLIARAPYLAGADEDLDLMARSMEKAANEKDSATARCLELEGRLEELKIGQARREGADVEDVEAIEEELSECLELREHLAFRRDALARALATIRESVSEFQEGHLERLAARAAALVRRMSGGRRERLTLDGNYVPVLHDRSGAAERPGDLSHGARDQLHLALRLAVSEEIGGAGLPILMDDVLVNCDASRVLAIRELLADGPAGRQVLLFTHDPAYRDWGRVTLLEDGGISGDSRLAAGAGGR